MKVGDDDDDIIVLSVMCDLPSWHPLSIILSPNAYVGDSRSRSALQTFGVHAFAHMSPSTTKLQPDARHLLKIKCV
jgi:hypothetical protein